jgi:outer membrane biosynthesis protein TonB
MRNNKGSYNVTGDAKGIKVTPKGKPKPKAKAKVAPKPKAKVAPKPKPKAKVAPKPTANVAPKPQPTAFVHNRTDRPTMRQLQQQGMQGMSVEDAKAQVANPPRNKGFQGIYKSSPEQKAELAKIRKAYLESQGGWNK